MSRNATSEWISHKTPNNGFQEDFFVAESDMAFLKKKHLKTIKIYI